MVIGTFWMLSARRSAVTITSCSSLPVPVAVAVSAAANTTAEAGALRIAATAAEIFGLGFIAHSPFVVIFPRRTRRARTGEVSGDFLYQSPVRRLNRSAFHAASADSSTGCVFAALPPVALPQQVRSEERRVGKECRSG